LRILVASPGGVEEERQSAEAVVRNVNEMLSHTNVRFEAILAERHVVPDVASRAQEVVNKQVGHYDVFLGIMGARFGTDTGKAGSGTEEEFEAALKRRAVDKGPLPKIMMYFKTEGIALRDIDPDQLKKVNAFKARARGEGVFHGEFKSVGDFEQLLRVHLLKVALEVNESERDAETSKSPARDDAIVADVASSAADEWEIGDEGFLDLDDVAADAMLGATTILNKYSEALERTTTRINEENTMIVAEVESGRANAKKIRSSLARIVVEMDTLRHALAGMRPEFRERMEIGLRSYGKMAVLMQSVGHNVDDSLELIRNLTANMTTARDGMRGLSKTTIEIPPISRDINKARRLLAAEIGAFANDVEAGVRLMKEVEALLSGHGDGN